MHFWQPSETRQPIFKPHFQIVSSLSAWAHYHLSLGHTQTHSEANLSSVSCLTCSPPVGMAAFISMVTPNQTTSSQSCCVCEQKRRMNSYKHHYFYNTYTHLFLFIICPCIRFCLSFPLIQTHTCTHRDQLLIASNSRHVHASLVSCCLRGV